jgi:hypothetical protein
VRDQHGDVDPVCAHDVVALDPERVVVGKVEVVAVGRVLELLTRSDGRPDPIGPVRARDVERRRDGEPEVERQRGSKPSSAPEPEPSGPSGSFVQRYRMPPEYAYSYQREMAASGTIVVRCGGSVTAVAVAVVPL